MGPWNRIWILFVIVAVGLVLSWGQVGRKAGQRLQAEPGPLLRTESPCRPWQAPCAAIGAEVALVLGPAGARRLLLKYVGAAPAELAELRLLESGGERRAWTLTPERVAPALWQLQMPELPAGTLLELRVRCLQPAVSAVFPL